MTKDKCIASLGDMYISLFLLSEIDILSPLENTQQIPLDTNS